MAEKFSLYFGEPLALVTLGYEDQRSARVNQVAADWLQLITSATPRLPQADWLAVIDALKGAPLMADPTTLRYAWAEVAESPGLGAKWGIDQPALAGKIKGLDSAGLIALREVVTRYWQEAHQSESHTQALVRCGAVVEG